MVDGTVGEGARYWAFISYSHRDAAFGRRLHRQLESYVLPRRLVGRTTRQGVVPRRPTPIFGSRDELTAAGDPTAEVGASRSLIVVCSPSSAASPWVRREIELFRSLHPDRPVLAAVLQGEPAECFPEALAAPLAADFRRDRDGSRLGLLKLVAGMVGVGLDELVQRDAHRRTRCVTAVIAAALAAMAVMGVLTMLASSARTIATREGPAAITAASSGASSDCARAPKKSPGRNSCGRKSGPSTP
jgi:MTH538 TIR-like domain (DUF1863)